LTAGTNFRNFLVGLAGELVRAEGYLKSYQDEYDPRTTTLFIEEWEKALGIPDDCFPGNGSIENRRRDVLIKLASLGVQTEQDFVDLAALFGVNVVIVSGVEIGAFPLTFPFLLLGEVQSRFTMVVQFTVVGGTVFPMTFPLIFGDEAIEIMQCLFNKLKPANVQIIYQEV